MSEKKKSIFLCGFMGCGKSTTGRLLAQKLGCNFIDMDDYIVSEQGKTREVLNNLNVIIAELKEVIINDKNEWECPQCHNKDHNKMNVTRRTCGYLGENFWNVGKTKEINSRVLHI